MLLLGTTKQVERPPKVVNPLSISANSKDKKQ